METIKQIQIDVSDMHIPTDARILSVSVTDGKISVKTGNCESVSVNYEARATRKVTVS